MRGSTFIFIFFWKAMKSESDNLFFWNRPGTPDKDQSKEREGKNDDALSVYAMITYTHNSPLPFPSPPPLPKPWYAITSEIRHVCFLLCLCTHPALVSSAY